MGPINGRDLCNRAAFEMDMDYEVVNNSNKPAGCVVVSKKDQVVFNKGGSGHKGTGCKHSNQCVCLAPYGLDEDKCANPVTKSGCKEVVEASGGTYSWENMIYTKNKPRGCFLEAERNVDGKIVGGEIFFNMKGVLHGQGQDGSGTECKWGTPCVCKA